MYLQPPGYITISLIIIMSKERTTRRGRLLTTIARDGRATYRLWCAAAHGAFLSLQLELYHTAALKAIEKAPSHTTQC